MRIIPHDRIMAENISPLACYDWACDAIKLKNSAALPAKISLKPRSGVFYNSMPVLIPAIARGGIKLVNRYPGRTPSLDSQILLYDLETGECLALLDGNWITAMRTGAVAAHSMKLFAKPDFSVLGYIGLGNIARSSLSVFLSLYPDRKLTVKLKKYKRQHELFAERFAAHDNVSFEYCDTYAQTIKGSDIVVQAATYLSEDICGIDAIDEGTLVVPIHTRGFTQCDMYFDKIFADDTEHVKGFRNFDRFKRFAEVGDVVSGSAKGRQNERERIMVYNIGIALHDIYFASKIYELLGNACREISLNPPPDKFWI